MPQAVSSFGGCHGLLSFSYSAAHCVVRSWCIQPASPPFEVCHRVLAMIPADKRVPYFISLVLPWSVFSFIPQKKPWINILEPTYILSPHKRKGRGNVNAWAWLASCLFSGIILPSSGLCVLSCSFWKEAPWNRTSMTYWCLRLGKNKFGRHS